MGLMPDSLINKPKVTNLESFVDIYQDYEKSQKYQMGFGKFKGWTVSGVPSSYFHWAKTEIKGGK